MRNKLIEDCLLHFDFPESSFAQYRFIERGKKSIYLVARNIQPSEEFIYQGIPFLRIQTLYPKITSVAAMKFGCFARRNIVRLNSDQVRNFLQRTPIRIARHQEDKCDYEAYTLVFFKEHCLGVGYLTSAGELASLLPKAWSEFRAGDDRVIL